jgi:hypothetical protein
LKVVKASVSITGELWQLKARPEVLKDVVVDGQLKRQQLTTHLIGKNRRTVFTPDRVSIESESGVLEEARDDPRSAFQGQRLETPWDDLQMAISAATRYGTISQSSFSTPIPVLSPKSSRPGKKMVSTGVH